MSVPDSTVTTSGSSESTTHSGEGSLLSKTISIPYLNSKFDTFFNKRKPPLFKLTIDNPNKVFGTFYLTLLVDSSEPNIPDTLHNEPNQSVTQYSPLGQITDTGFTSPSFWHEGHIGPAPAYIENLNASKFELNAVGGTLAIPPTPPTVHASITFDPGGKINVEHDDDIEIDKLVIYLDLEISLGRNIPDVVQSDNLNAYVANNPAELQDVEVDLRGYFDLFGWIEEIEAVINAPPDAAGEGKVWYTFRGQTYSADNAGDVKSAIIGRFIHCCVDAHVNQTASHPRSDIDNDIRNMIYNYLSPVTAANSYDSTVAASADPKGSIASALSYRFGIAKYLTTWLSGVDCLSDPNARPIADMASDSQNLYFDYQLPSGALPPFEERPQTPLSPGLLSNIKNIVVVMQENRSFDHMLGYLNLPVNTTGQGGGRGRTDIDGLGTTAANITNRYGHKSYSSFLASDPAYVHETPPHDFDHVKGQINGGQMNGFVDQFAMNYQLGPDHPDNKDVMGYFDGQMLTTYDYLAQHYLVCDRWFASHPGPTFPNRFYYLTGRLNRDSTGTPELNNFSGETWVPVRTRNILDHLSEHGVTWRYYENRYCTARLYANYTYDNVNIVDFNDPDHGFAATCAAGTLPAVTFIDPNFIDEPDSGDNDDAAPGNVTHGQSFVCSIVKALRHSPQWPNSLLVVVYDEHGGFFDHVNPQAPENTLTAVDVSSVGFSHFGVRVPAFVVSPWIAPGTASHVVFDHTSVLKTIIRTFMSASPPDMGVRVSAANDLSQVLQDHPYLPIEVLPPLPCEGQSLNQLAKTTAKPSRTQTPPATGTSTEFKDVMRHLQKKTDRVRKMSPVAGVIRPKKKTTVKTAANKQS